MPSRRAFLKLLLAISGATSLMHFVGYGKYLSVQTKVNFEKKRIANLSQLPRNSAIIFQWPTDIRPYDTNVLMRDDAGELHAYNRVCTHLQCLVNYDPKLRLITCPCHGSIFKPSTGEVEAGPAPRPLPIIKLEVDKDGEIYAVASEGEFGYGR